MPGRILIVDDEAQTTGGMRRFLEKRGYEVHEVKDSTKALAADQAFQTKAVILDYRMPGMHGGDVAWQLASDPQLRSIKVIVCSAASRREIMLRLPPVRIPILEKPVETSALLELLES
jgi:CheY-like chemotaxis protein